MGIVVERQSIVSDVVYTVFRLHHRTQSYRLDGILLTGAFGIRHQRIQRLGDGTLRATGLHLITELRHKLAQVLEFRRIGLVVDTVRQCLRLLSLLHTSNRLCDGLVGQQHEFLDELVGIFRGLEIGSYRLTCLVDIEMQFLTVELHGTVLETGGTQFLGKGIEFDEHLRILTLIGILLRSWGRRFTRAILHTIVLQDLLHLLIGITTVTLNHRMSQVPLLDVRLIVELEDHTVTEFLLIRTERADKVTEALWQHRDGAVHEVDTRRTVVGFLVNDGALLHVV